MKKFFYTVILLAVGLQGCELDNYEPPKSAFTGRLVYEGNPLGIRQGISVLQLFQPGFQTVTPINQVGIWQFHSNGNLSKDFKSTKRQFTVSTGYWGN